MANKIQIRRGLKSALPTLSAGEPAYTTDTRELFVGTGSGNVNMGGSHWYTGTAMSGTSTATTYSYSACPQVKLGDIYLNTTYGYVYQCTTAGSGTTAKWTYKGSIKGAAGSNATVTVDSALSSTSTNPVQNKVVKTALDEKLDTMFASNGYIGIDMLTQDVVDIIDSKLAPPTTITIGCVDSKHSWLIDYACTGSNDTILFQNAINALPDFGGKIVVLEGEYNITSQLTCNKNVIIEGMGDGTVINCTSSSFLYNGDSVDAICLKNIKVNSKNTSNSFISTISPLVIDSCNINITATNTLTSNYIYADSTINVSNSNIVADINVTFADCIRVFKAEDSVGINNCNIKLYNNYSAASGSNQGGDLHLVYAYATICGCHIQCCGNSSKAQFVDIVEFDDSTVSGNVINLGVNGSITKRGYSTISEISSLSITGNNIIHDASGDVYVCGAVSGNRIKLSSGYLYLHDCTSFVGNTVLNHATDDVKVYSSSAYVNAVGNLFKYACTSIATTDTNKSGSLMF